METNEFFKVYDKVLPLVKDTLRANDAILFKYNSCTIGLKQGNDLIYTVRLSGYENPSEIKIIADEVKKVISRKDRQIPPIVSTQDILTKLRILRESILNSNDRQQFDDIIKCYESGLLRAGYLLGWLLLMESLKSKILYLADKEVKVAMQERDKIIEKENKHESTDVAICDAAHLCDIITDESRAELHLLWQKRCIMGHPYTPVVKELDFIYLVEKLVSMCLAVPLMWSKQMITSFFEDIKKASHLIPLSDEDIVEEIISKVALIPEKLYPYFWKSIFYEFSLSLDEKDYKRQKYLKWMAIKFIREKKIDINEECFGLESRIKDYPDVCWRILFYQKIWDTLDDKYKDQLFRYLNEKKSGRILFFAKKVIECDKGVTQEHLNCYYNALERLPLEVAYTLYVEKTRLIDRIYARLISTNQFEDQGAFVDLLGTMEKEVDSFPDKQRETLGGYLCRCCANNTYKAINYIGAGRGCWLSNREFVLGFVQNAIILDNSIKFDLGAFRYLLYMLKATTPGICEEVLNMLSSTPIKKVKDIYYESRRVKKMLDEELSSLPNIREQLERIADEYYDVDNGTLTL